MFTLSTRLFVVLGLVFGLAAGCGGPEEMEDGDRRMQPANLAEEENPAADETPADGSGADEVVSPRGRDDDGVLDDLVQELSLQDEEARYHVKRGDELYSENRFAEAANAYQRALELNPTLDDVRVRYNNALIMTGERAGEVQAVKQDLVEKSQVEREQRKLVVERNLREGREALAANDLERAERLVAQAVDEISVDPEFEQGTRREAEELLRRVRDERARRDAERREAMLRDAQDKANAELAQESEIRYRQVQTLLRKASEFIRLKDYEKAIEACERIIQIDPGNVVAKYWLSDSREQLFKERRAKLIADRVENEKLNKENFAEAAIAYQDIFVFPGSEEWERIRMRERDLVAVNLEDPEPVRRTKNALETTRLQEINFDATPLEDVVRQLRTITGANIAIDPGVDASALTVTMKVDNLPAINALNLILENVGLTYTFRENVVYITNPGQQAGRVEFAIYNVSDILNKIRDFEGPELILKASGDTAAAPISFTAADSDEDTALDPETLVELVKQSTGGETIWTDPNTIEYHAGQFLVNASRETHAQLQTVLENLRKDSDLFVVIEARFIDVTDDFLEDIGVDSRSLGAVNNIGTPFGNIINDNRTGGQDLGFTESGDPVNDTELIMGQDRWAGRAQHIIDGFTGGIRGTRLSGGQGIGGLSLQLTWLEPFQINVIIRAVQERSDVRQLTAPVVTAHNGQRVFVSVITQRAYIADYNLVSGGTGFAIIEVADPEVQTFQEGVILDVDPVISHDKKYVTLDVKPTLATLINGIISTIKISLGSFTNVAFQVPIGVPEIALQQAFTSVTVPNGGTVLLGGFKSLNEAKYTSFFPILGQIPILENLFRRRATLQEERSLVILLSVRIVDLRGEEDRKFNRE
jgi:general secretion pathway protein D